MSYDARMDHYSRHTGHSTRMLREAIILVLCGKTVAVITNTEYTAKDLRRQTEKISRRLGADNSDRWNADRLYSLGLKRWDDAAEQLKKDGVIVMGDPGLRDYAEMRGGRRIGLTTPPEWPT